VSKCAVKCKPSPDDSPQYAPLGMYFNQSLANHTDLCAKCPHGRTSKMIGARYVEECTSCTSGFKMSIDSSCLKCPNGTYSQDIDSTSCIGCPLGKYSGTAPSSSCNDCEVGRFNSVTNQTTCVLCPLGKFLPIKGSASILNCIGCPAGTYGSLDSSMCISCHQ
jgi:hypothetical protein